MDEPGQGSRCRGVVAVVLAGVNAGELSCSTGYRTRLEDAVVALEALARGRTAR